MLLIANKSDVESLIVTLVSVLMHDKPWSEPKGGEVIGKMLRLCVAMLNMSNASRLRVL